MNNLSRYFILLTLILVSHTSVCFAAKAPGVAVVYMQDYHFSPSTLIISPGQKVVWINKGKKDHTVTSDAGYFDSGRIHPGAKVSYTFTKPGTYYYSCKPHSFLFFGMKGKVIVK